MTGAAAMTNRWLALAVTGLAVILSMTAWFSATAVTPELAATMALTPTQAAWLTNGVQLGFVIGALSSSLLSFADVWRITWLMAAAACVAGIANAGLLLEPGATGAIASRIATGAALASIYPPAMKFIGTWFRTGRGLAMGTLVGALTFGSAMPHLVRAVGVGFDWRMVIITSSVACLLGAVIFLFLLREGPYPFARTKVDPRHLGAILRNRPIMLANTGYFGHMWELYAMWGWLLAYAGAAQSGGLGLGSASLLTFAVIALGAPSCIAGGWLADRIGRCNTTAISMAISGTCALAIGLAFDGPAWLFVGIVLVWGFTVVADSAQFSATVSELSDQSLVGSSLAFQMGVGFAITMITIWLVPQIAEWAGGWRWSFLVLVPGPVAGVIAMLLLKRRPEAVKIANGLR